MVLNGWFPKMVTHVVNQAREFPKHEFLALATVRRRIMQQMGARLKGEQFWLDEYGRNHRWSQTDWDHCPNKPDPGFDFSSSAFTNANPEKSIPILVSELTRYVNKYPEGGDRGLLSVAVDWVKDHIEDDVYLSDLASLIRKRNLTASSYGLAEDQARQKVWKHHSAMIPARTYTHEDTPTKKKAKLDQAQS
jgi:hypothetical protein